MKNYQFFSHKKCEYYPCHDTNQPINCLFCYCPLYVLSDCGGNYTIKGDIKDCSQCLLPHNQNNYEYITQRYNDIVKKIK